MADEEPLLFSELSCAEGGAEYPAGSTDGAVVSNTRNMLVGVIRLITCRLVKSMTLVSAAPHVVLGTSPPLNVRIGTGERKATRSFSDQVWQHSRYHRARRRAAAGLAQLSKVCLEQCIYTKRTECKTV